MLTETNIKIASILSGIGIAGLAGVLFSLPGLLLGSILGYFAAIMLIEHLRKFIPENRRRLRRTLRNEGLR
jgi:hypothetical protein